MNVHHGRFIEDLEVGMSEEFVKIVSGSDIELFADVSGDTNPLHLDEDYAATTMFRTRIAHGMLTASYISTILGTRLPGPGCIYLSQSIRFKAPVRPGDEVTARAVLCELDRPRRRATFTCECLVGDVLVLDGVAEVLVPSRAA
jgi:3-hydroxybutyryl-CoA dehydratase